MSFKRDTRDVLLTIGTVNAADRLLDLNNPNSFFGRQLAWIGLLGMSMLMGLIYVVDSFTDHHEAEIRGFNTGFAVIVVKETNESAIRRLSSYMEDAKKNIRELKYNARTHIKFNSINNRFLSDLPKVVYSEQHLGSDDITWTELVPVYAVFKAPNALQQFKNWLKENNYSEYKEGDKVFINPRPKNTDFKIEFESYSNTSYGSSYATHGVWETPVSSITTEMFFYSKGNGIISNIFHGGFLYSLSQRQGYASSSLSAAYWGLHGTNHESANFYKAQEKFYESLTD